MRVSRRLLLGGAVAGLAAKKAGAWSHGQGTYLGQVANRCGYLPSATPGWLQAMTSSVHTLTDNVTSIQVAFPNFWMNNQTETSTVGATTFTAAAQLLGAATMTQMTWSGSSSLTTSANITPLCDALSLTASQGQQIKINVYRTNSTNCPIYFPAGGNFCNTGFGEGCLLYMSGGIDQTMVATQLGDTASPVMYLPILIVAQTQRPSVFLIGDSLLEGYKDFTLNQSGDVGTWARSMTPLNVGSSNMGTLGEPASSFITGSAIRRSIAGYFSHIGNAFGTDDILAGALAAQVYSSLIQVKGLFPGKPVLISTITPSDSSSDGWITIVNQSNLQQQIAPTNVLIKANSAGFSSVVDIASVLADLATGFWQAPPAQTNDGTHEITSANLTLQSSGIFTSSMFQR